MKLSRPGKISFGNTIKRIFFLAGFSLFLFSCGIEDYPYIYPIPADKVQNRDDTKVDIAIPNDNSSNNYFTHFTIYYRIYISNVSELNPSESNLDNINTVLYSDYLKVIGNDSMSGSSVLSLFNNMNYYPLALEGASIDSVLSKSIFRTPPTKTTITINFPSIGFSPYFEIKEVREIVDVDTGDTTIEVVVIAEYILHRYDNISYGIEIIPDNGYFLNTREIRDPENITISTINPDVEDIDDSEEEKIREYTYVSMFIVASGFDNQTLNQLFSTPTFIGVFRLPNPF